MIPITDVTTMRESDAVTIKSGISGRELMARAGRGIFESHAWKGPVAIVCGSGNNAGDGYVLALELHAAKIPCTLVLLSERFSEDGAYYYEQCVSKGISSVLYSLEVSFDGFAEIADCIFGTGFCGNAEGIAREVIEKINQSGAFVLSADINSGLCGDNGMGGAFVKSDLTVSVGTLKQGHFLGNAKDAISAIQNIDIGIPVPSKNVFLCEERDFSGILKPRHQNSHKGNYGYVTVMGGCREYAGAVKLANMSAATLRAGCGVARLAVPESIADSVSPYLLESTLMPLPADGAGKMRFDEEALERLLSGQAALAIGMGWGRASSYEQILSYILNHASLSLVIDADGLNTLSEMDLVLLKKTACRVVLTPHLKEFERLCGVSIPQILCDPIKYAREFAKRYGVILLLKGCTTVITDGEVVYLVDRGCAGMATAGSGDVLSGILCGILGYSPVSALSVACGAYLAGLAGELAEKDVNSISMIASDTVAHIPEAVRRMI